MLYLGTVQDACLAVGLHHIMEPAATGLRKERGVGHWHRLWTGRAKPFLMVPIVSQIASAGAIRYGLWFGVRNVPARVDIATDSRGYPDKS